MSDPKKNEEKSGAHFSWRWLVILPLGVYVIIQQPWKLWVPYFALLLALTTAFILIAPKILPVPSGWTRRKIRKTQFEVWWWGTERLLFVYFLFCAGYDFAVWLIQSATAPTHNTSWGFILVTATILVGALFFVFRLKYRALYGITEIVAGISLAVYKVSGSKASGLDPELLTALLTASAYLIVRGADNVHQGFKAASSKDHLAQRILYFIIGEPEEVATAKEQPVTADGQGAAPALVPLEKEADQPEDPHADRAKMIVANVVLDRDEGLATITITNIGDTEAQNIKWIHQWSYVHSFEKPDFNYRDRTQKGHVYSKVPPHESRIWQIKVLKGDLIPVDNGGGFIYAQGRVDYWDVYGRAHWLTYSYYYASKNGHFLMSTNGENGAGPV